jgi:uncharacterized tellurite resistance protein B-like protein
MENDGKILEGHSDLEKGAYLGAIASIATADRSASPEEIDYLSQLCDAAELSEQQKSSVINAATELSGAELTRCLDILKNSDLKYSLVTDLIAFAKSDDEYNEAEQQSVQKISQYLGVNQQQFSLLDEFAEKATTANASPGKTGEVNSLFSSGLKDKMQNAGISSNGLLKGLLGVAAPFILGSMMGRGLRGRTSFGHSGGMFSGGGGFFGGGLGSVIGMLNGGRGMGNMGGLFGRILGGRF